MIVCLPADFIPEVFEVFAGGRSSDLFLADGLPVSTVTLVICDIRNLQHRVVLSIFTIFPFHSLKGNTSCRGQK